MTSKEAIKILNDIDFFSNVEYEAVYMAIQALRKNIPTKPNKNPLCHFF